MYDPKVARFLQEDTYTGDINDPLSLNLYTYCHNEPLMYWDPTGHKEGDWWDVIANTKFFFRTVTNKEEREKALDLIAEYDESPFPIRRFAVNPARFAGWISDKVEEAPEKLERFWSGVEQTPKNPEDARLGWFSSGAISGSGLIRLAACMNPLDTRPVEEKWVYWARLERDGIERYEENVSNWDVYTSNKMIADSIQAAEGVSSLYKGTKGLYKWGKDGFKPPSFMSDGYGNAIEPQTGIPFKNIPANITKAQPHTSNIAPNSWYNNYKSIVKSKEAAAGVGGVNPKIIKGAQDINSKALSGKIKYGNTYHGRLGKELEIEILSNPDAVYVSSNKSQNLIYRKGGDVVIVESTGSAKGNVITSYGPSGARGESGAAIFGGKPTDPGFPVTHGAIINGEVPTPSGGTLPAATEISLK